MKNLIFLGAGASKADGAPLQGELFKEYFNMRLIKNKEDFGEIFGTYEENDDFVPMDLKIERKVKEFFNNIFGIDGDDNDKFPTFEEALGMLDLAIGRKEYFYNRDRTYNLDSLKTYSYESYRLALVLSMAEVIEYKLRQSKGKYHKKLIENINNADSLSSTTFVSTNYDILIDNAIFKTGSQIDYGFNAPTNSNNIQLLKIHGSLNWLYCPVCKKIQITPLEKGTIRLLGNLMEATCPKCHSLSEAIIVPPTFFKEYSNFFLSTVWNKAEEQITNADNIIFCGYSFPDADIYIKYLLKRGELNYNNNKDLKIHVVNFYDSKPKQQCDEEEKRYLRFFKNKGKIHYTNMSFEDFVSDPLKLMK